MSEQKYADRCILVYAVALFAATIAYAASNAAAKTVVAKHGGARTVAAKHVADKHLIAKHLVAQHLAAKHLLAKHVAAKNVTAKNAAAKNAAAKNVAAKNLLAKHAVAKHAAAKNAATKNVAAKNANPQDITSSISLNRLAGSWKGVKSGLEIKIEQGAIGWEAWLSTEGQARITQPEADPQIIKIQSRSFTCTYTVTLPAAQTMKWEAAAGQPDSRCLGDSFTKMGPAPPGGRPAAPVKPAVQSKPPVTSTMQL